MSARGRSPQFIGVEMAHWELFSHDADIGIRGIGETPAKAFEMAAKALTAVVVDPERVLASKTISLELEEKDLEFLFFEWINHLIHETDTQKMLFKNFEVTIEDQKLLAKISGDELCNIPAHISVKIKRPTFNALKVIHFQGNWTAQCVIDL